MTARSRAASLLVRRIIGPVRLGHGLVMAAALIIALVVVSLHPGGQGTQAESSSVTTRIIPTALAAFDAQHLIVVGTSENNKTHGAMATSVDGGLAWSSKELDTPPLNGVAARGSTVIVTADCANTSGPDCVWRSSDGGASFVSLPGLPMLVRPALADERTGWIMTPQVRGQGTTLWDTYDGGNTWAQTTPECDLVAMIFSTVSLSFPSVNEGWTACVGSYSGGHEARVIVRSSATGSTRETMSEVGGSAATGSLPAEGELHGMSMTTDGSGWLWTADQLYATHDAGRTWTPVARAGGSEQRQIVEAVLVSHESGFAILAGGSSPTAAVTHDSGTSWESLRSFPA